MHQYPIATPLQLRAILRSLRKSRNLTQTELGQRLGVSQKRIARIEAAPEVTSFDQIARMVSAMGARLLLEETPPRVAEPSPSDKDAW